jgi:general secretion pathway protein D
MPTVNVPSARGSSARPARTRRPSPRRQADGEDARKPVTPEVRGGTGRLPAPPAESTEPEESATNSGATGGSSESQPDHTDVITFKTNFEKDIRCQRLPLDLKISIDFEEAPLEDVVKFMACIRAQNFLIDMKVLRGKTVTIMSPEPVTVYEAYRAFLSTLAMNGLTVVQAGAFKKIIPVKLAPGDHAPIIRQGRSVPNEDRVVSYLMTLKHVQASDLNEVISKFKSPEGDIYVYEPSNTLIITDSARNVRRLKKLVSELDVSTGREHIFIRPVLHAEAGKLKEAVESLFGAKESGGASKPRRSPSSKRSRSSSRSKPSPTSSSSTTGGFNSATVTKIIADERTNQLIIVATKTSYLIVDRFLRKMDVPIPGEGELHIYELQNADAKEVATTLQSLAQGRSSSSRSRKPASSSGGRQKSRSSSSSSPASLFSGEVKITAHEQTNALLIEASLTDFHTLERVIQKLDVRRKQVYVEALIMEVSTSRDRKFGINGSGGSAFDIDGEVVPLLLGLGGLGVGSFDMNQLNRGGLAVGMQGPLIDVSTGSGSTSGLGTLSIPSFGFLLQAISSSSDVNIISTPHILTLENEEAEIQVGKKIPYQGTTFGGLGGLGGLAGLGALGGLGGIGQSSTAGMAGLSSLGGLGGGLGGLGGLGGGGMGSVQFVDADLTLKIKPQVNESNFVRLEIEESIEDVESMDRILGPTTSKRKVQNVVVVRDQQPVVIGGLIRTSETEGLDRIPFLGDIPLIGALFRQTSTIREKKNLLLIIVPHIIHDPSDLQRVHMQRLKEMRQFNEYMSTHEASLRGEMDYRKKHGALEEIHRVIQTRLDRVELLKRLEKEQEVDELGTPESHLLDFDAPLEEPGHVGETVISAPEPENESDSASDTEGGE